MSENYISFLFLSLDSSLTTEQILRFYWKHLFLVFVRLFSYFLSVCLVRYLLTDSSYKFVLRKKFDYFIRFGFGKRFSDTTDEIDNAIIQLDWYLFPHEIERILPIVMQNTQEPSVIKFFGNCSCSHMQFRKVCFLLHVPNEFYNFM